MNRAYSLSRRSLLAVAGGLPLASLPAPAMATPFATLPKLHRQYFAALVRDGRMTVNQVRDQLRRAGGPDWPSLPASVIP